MTWFRLAVRLAVNRGVEQRWRQVCAVGTALIAAVLALGGVGLMSTSLRAVDVIHARSPIWAQPGDAATLEISLRGFAVDNGQAVVVWLQPAPGHEHDPAVVPPGLRALPDPGEAVLSPGLVARGLSATSLGFAESDAGLGPHGAIGPDGVISATDAWMYVRPAPGRTLGEGGALLSTVGYAGSGGERAPFEAGPDIPTPAFMGALLVWLLLLPSLFLLATGARALSPIRAERARLLHRLGVSRLRVRVLLGVETAVLAGVGVLLGTAIWVFAASRVSRLPLTGTALLPGALNLPVPTIIATALVIVALAAVSGAFTLATCRARARQRPASVMRLVPLVLGVVCMVASRVLSSGASLSGWALVVGAIVAFASLPLAVPPLAGRVGDAVGKSTRRPAVWLAGRRLTSDSATLARPATAVGMLVLIAGAAFAMYANMIAPEGDQLALDGRSALYSVDWRDPDNGDLATFTQAIPESTVYPIGETDQGGVLIVARCTDLPSLERSGLHRRAAAQASHQRS